MVVTPAAHPRLYGSAAASRWAPWSAPGGEEVFLGHLAELRARRAALKRITGTLVVATVEPVLGASNG